MSEHDNQSGLLPPVQNEPGVLFGDPSMMVPQFRFAVAELTTVESTGEHREDPDVRIRVSRAIPAAALFGHGSGENAETMVENVEQTYVVSIPYTERIDGIEVPRVRTETRKRVVPTRRHRHPPVVPSGKPLVKQSYTVCVPYIEQVPLADGSTMTVTRSRQETRTRMVDPDAASPRLIGKIISNDYKVALTKCFLPTGVELSDAEKLKRLSKPLPVLLVSGTEKIDSYFEALLNADALIIVEPGSGADGS